MRSAVCIPLINADVDSESRWMSVLQANPPDSSMRLCRLCVGKCANCFCHSRVEMNAVHGGMWHAWLLRYMQLPPSHSVYLFRHPAGRLDNSVYIFFIFIMLTLYYTNYWRVGDASKKARLMNRSLMPFALTRWKRKRCEMFCWARKIIAHLFFHISRRSHFNLLAPLACLFWKKSDFPPIIALTREIFTLCSKPRSMRFEARQKGTSAGDDAEEAKAIIGASREIRRHWQIRDGWHVNAKRFFPAPEKT